MDVELEYEPTKKDLQNIREWIAKMPHIVQDYDDYLLSAVLRASKGRLQKAKTTLENFNGLGCRFPKFFGHLDPLSQKTRIYLNATFVFPLTKKLENGSSILIMAPRNDLEVDFTDFDLFEVLRILQILWFVVLWERIEGNTKWITIYDFTGEKSGRMKTLTPKSLWDCVQITESFPIRIEAIHFVNIPRFMEPIVNLLKSLTKSKIAKRFYFHSSLDSLHCHIPRDYLPEEYGGNEMNLRTLNDIWRKKMESYRDKLTEESNKMRKLDHLRPKLQDKDQELYGAFRQLVID